MPNDRYLIETSLLDGYLLQDGSGVLILETGVATIFLDAAPGGLLPPGSAAGQSIPAIPPGSTMEPCSEPRLVGR